MDHYGGAKSTNPITNLLNKIRSYSLSNPNAGVYNVAGGSGNHAKLIFEETLNKLGG